MVSTIQDRFNVVPEEGIKSPVRMATDANITLSGLQTIDGISGAENDRVLVRSQTVSSENGVWVMQLTAWVRASDWDDNTDVVSGMLVTSSEGTLYEGVIWKGTFVGVFTIDTTEVVFTGAPIVTDTDLRYGPIFATLTAAKASNPVSIDGALVILQAGMTVYVQGKSTAGDLGQSQYLVAASQSVDNQKDHDAANGTVLLYQEPSADVLNMEHIGGVTATAINAAVDSLDSGDDIFTGGKIRFGTGQHAMDDTIVFDNTGVSRLSSLSIIGSTKQGATLDFATAGAGKIGIDMINPIFNRMADMAIRNATLSAVRLKSKTHDVLLDIFSHVAIDRVRLSGNGSHGLEAGEGFMTHVNQLFCSGNTGNGFDLTDLHTSWLFSNCFADGNTGEGYRLNKMTYTVMNACASDNNGFHGYEITESHTTVLNGCGNESNQRSGFNFESSTADGENINITLNGCFGFNNNGNNGGWANFVRVAAANDKINRIILKACKSQAPANPIEDVIVTGKGAYVVDEDNDFPSGIKSASQGYIHHVNRTVVIHDLSVTAATDVIELSSPQGNQTDFGGMIAVRAVNGDPASSGAKNTATYQLLVDKGVLGGNVTEIAKLGVTTGAAANHPSFTWTLNGNFLEATPVASTTGTFSFEILCQGPSVKVK